MEHLNNILPQIALAAGVLLLLMLEPFIQKHKQKFINLFVSLAVVGTSLAFFLSQVGQKSTKVFGGSLVIDQFGISVSIIVLLGTLLVILSSHNYISRIRSNIGEYYIMLLISTLGIICMVFANDMLTFFICFEVMSIAVYILCGIVRMNPYANEAAMKYLVLGTFSTGLMLMGLALIYGATGEVEFSLISQKLFSFPVESSDYYLGLFGGSLLLVGFLFKIGAVPFHSWIPDVYEGAPLSITGFMATIIKAGTFAALMRVLFTMLNAFQEQYLIILSVASVLTMVVGNLWAINQKSIKRLLAYSSIAHTGYILLAVIAAGMTISAQKSVIAFQDIEGTRAVIFYLFAYTLMNIGVFSTMMAAGNDTTDLETFEDYKGFGYKNKFIGLSMSAFLFSLAGIPTTAGFIGKFFIFKSALTVQMIILSIIGILMSIVSIYYYIKPIIYLYMRDDESEYKPHAIEWNYAFVLFFSLVFILIFGIWPHSVYKFLVNLVA